MEQQVITVEFRVYSPEDKKAWLFRSSPVILRTVCQKNEPMRDVINNLLIHTQISCYSTIDDFILKPANHTLLATDNNIPKEDKRLVKELLESDSQKILIIEAYGKNNQTKANSRSCILY